MKAWLAIVTLLGGLVVAANRFLSGPVEPPMRIDDHGSGIWQAIDEPDAQPANWPTNAQLTFGDAMLCRPMIVRLGKPPKTIVRT